MLLLFCQFADIVFHFKDHNHNNFPWCFLSEIFFNLSFLNYTHMLNIDHINLIITVEKLSFDSVQKDTFH